jgi:ATP-dependent RNA helicase SUPV3L1/SUV3
MGARIAGFRGFGEQMLRIDMAERMARAAHEAIAKGEAFTAQSPQIVSLGLSEASFLQLMRLAGFRPVEAPAEGGANWAFRGRQKPRTDQQQARGHARRGTPARGAPSRPGSAAPAAAPASNHAFAGLAELLGRNG